MARAQAIWHLTAAAALAVALSGCNPSGKVAGGPGGPPRGPVEVGVATATPQRVVLSTDLPGRTAAFRVAEVRPQVGGIVQKRFFREGGDVKAGDPLYQINPAPYQAALAQAQADLQKAEASVSSLRAKMARYKDLIGANAVSRQDFDDVTASLKQAEAQVAAARAALDIARINLDYTKVTAPISGRIGKSAVTEGALVTANQATPLATVQQLDPIYVDVTQAATQMMQMRRDRAGGRPQEVATGPVTLLTDGGDYDQRGELQFADVTVDQSTGSVQIRAVFPNPRFDLLPGLFVRARVEQAAKDNAILVPQRAVLRGPDGGGVVWVVGDDNKIAPRPVKAEQAVGSAWLVTEGLAPGERYVVEGFQKARPGAEVKPVPAGAPGAPGAPAR